MEALRLLPIEMWREIALKDAKVWYSLVRVVPGLYLFPDVERMRELGKRIEIFGDTTVRYLYDMIHSDDGPAVFSSDRFGYYSLGQLHRHHTEGPAFSTPIRKIYYWRGKIHRPSLHGPAVEELDGTRLYYDNGVMTRDFREGPAEIRCMYHRVGYYRDGKLHREDGPALIENNKISYYRNGELYREDGPTICHFKDGRETPWEDWMDTLKDDIDLGSIFAAMGPTNDRRFLTFRPITPSGVRGPTTLR